MQRDDVAVRYHGQGQRDGPKLKYVIREGTKMLHPRVSFLKVFSKGLRGPGKENSRGRKD